MEEERSAFGLWVKIKTNVQSRMLEILRSIRFRRQRMRIVDRHIGDWTL
jgi:hypothetical protein